MRPRLLVGVLVLGALLAACNHAPTHITFDHGACLLEGKAATLEEVETAQAQLTMHMLREAPVYVGVTLAVVLLAGFSHVEKLYLFFATRRQPHEKGWGERLKLVLDRYRERPVRYFSIVAVTLCALAVAAGMYIYLDADKRASDRALAQLQFCQLSLKSSDEQAKLDAERKNLDALQSTVGQIRTVVDSLPPDQQAKAKELLGQLRASLGDQGKLLEKSQGELAAQLKASSSLIETKLGALENMPTALAAIADTVKRLDAASQQLDRRLALGDKRTLADAFGDLGGRLAATDGRIAAMRFTGETLPSGKTVAQTLDELASRPACPPVKCECVAPKVATRSPSVDGGAPPPAPTKTAGAGASAASK